MLTFPLNITISDELSYLNQALNINLAEDLYVHKAYPIGTPFILSLFVLILGKELIFLYGIVMIITIVSLCRNFFDRLAIHKDWSYLLFLYPPFCYLGRTLMSDLLGMLVILLCLLFFLKYEDKKDAFLLGLFSTLCLLIREPLVLISLPLVCYSFFQKKLFSFYLIVGLILGVALKLISNQYYFGEYFFIKDPGISFGFDCLIKNLLFYFSSFIVWVALIFYSKKVNYTNRTKTLFLTVIIYILFFSLYEYNGLNSGFFKAQVLGLRFMLPIIPIISILVLQTTKIELKRKHTYYFQALALTSFLFVNIYGYGINKSQMQIIRFIQNEIESPLITDDIGDISKFTSPLNSKPIELRHKSSISEVNKSMFYVSSRSKVDSLSWILHRRFYCLDQKTYYFYCRI